MLLFQGRQSIIETAEVVFHFFRKSVYCLKNRLGTFLELLNVIFEGAYVDFLSCGWVMRTEQSTNVCTTSVTEGKVARVKLV